MAEEALRAGAYYINRRWLGGMLTNFETIRARVNKLRELESKDLAEINVWRNDPELISQLGAPYRYINLRVDYSILGTRANEKKPSLFLKQMAPISFGSPPYQ